MGKRRSVKRIKTVDYGSRSLLTGGTIKQGITEDKPLPIEDSLGITESKPLTIPSSKCFYIQQRLSHVIGLVFCVTDSGTDDLPIEIDVTQNITHPNGLNSNIETFPSHNASYKTTKTGKSEYAVKLVDIGGITQAKLDTNILPKFDNIKELFTSNSKGPLCYTVVKADTITDTDNDITTKIDELFSGAPTMYESGISGENIKQRTVGIIEHIREALQNKVTFTCLYIKRRQSEITAYFSNAFYDDFQYLKSHKTIYLKIDGTDYINKDLLNTIDIDDKVKAVKHLDFNNPTLYTNLYIGKDYGNGNITAGNILECVDNSAPRNYLFTNGAHILTVFATFKYTRPLSTVSSTGGIKYKKYKTRRKQRKRRNSGYYTIVNRRKMNKSRAYYL